MRKCFVHTSLLICVSPSVYRSGKILVVVELAGSEEFFPPSIYCNVEFIPFHFSLDFASIHIRNNSGCNNRKYQFLEFGIIKVQCDKNCCSNNDQ